jgi:DNA-binding NtrC family response regulator
MGEGRFRDQLYHRLRECEIFIPSLRERQDDIQSIAEHYLKKHNAEMDDNKTIAPAAMDYLTEFQWPGNVRELVSVLRVALQTIGSDQLEISDLERILKRSPTTPGSKNVTPSNDVMTARAQAPSEQTEEADDAVDLSSDRSLKDDLARVDQMKIEKTLERSNGNVSKSAAILGVSRETLHNKIRKYGIDVKAYRKK